MVAAATPRPKIIRPDRLRVVLSDDVDGDNWRFNPLVSFSHCSKVLTNSPSFENCVIMCRHRVVKSKGVEMNEL